MTRQMIEERDFLAFQAFEDDVESYVRKSFVKR